MNDKELIELARKAKENAYAPYTHFKVGAALITEDGRVYSGCNIESPSDIEGTCAERNAIFKAISEGKLRIDKIAVASDHPDFIYPCGHCRQTIIEFGRNAKVIASKSNGEYRIHTISELLPYGYTGDEISELEKLREGK